MEEDLRTTFLKIFANLPLGERDKVIAVTDWGPISWFVAWIEVKEKTEKGDEILNKLRRMEII